MANNKFLSSTLPMDMSKLRAVTEGKSSLQEELLEMFFFNAKECVGVMEGACYDGESLKWRDASDELRKTSDVLGAIELSKICETANKIYDSTALDKREILKVIKDNINKVMVFVRNTRY